MLRFQSPFLGLAALVALALQAPASADDINPGAAGAGIEAAAEQVESALPDVSLPPSQTAIQIPSRTDLEDAIPEGTLLTGRDIYEKYLDNRQLHSALQHQKIISTDPGGSTQSSRFWVRWKDYTDEDDKPVDGVYAKTLVHFEEPYDMRNTGFLMIINEGGTSDQFVYRPSDRRVRRVNLSSGGIMGSDYTFDDIAFQNVEDAEYVRMPDEVHEGVPVYVVQATATPTARSEYHRTLSYMEQEHYVPLRVRYWDEDEVEVKELLAPHAGIKEFSGTWVSTESTMHNLKENTSSQMYVEKLDPNIELADRLFSVFRLETGR